MQLSTLRSIYDSTGPFSTVYLEGRSPAEDAEQQVRLRWDDLKGRLEQAGASEAAVEALENVVIVEDITEVQTDGRVLVANDSGVLLNEPWDAALGAGDAAHVSDQPELGDYLRLRAQSVSMLVAIADQQGAVVREVIGSPRHDPAEGSEETLAGATDEPVHKPRGGALSHKQIQRRADELVKQNAKDIADRLETLSKKQDPDVLVLAGEVQGRTALREELPTALIEILRDVDSGGVQDDGAENALAEELQAVAGSVAAERARETAERLEYSLAHNLAVQGAERVARAAEMGAIESVVLHQLNSVDNEAALLAAAAQIDSAVELTTSEIDGDIAAILRFEAPQELS